MTHEAAEIAKLAERVEAATGADRELDRLVYETINPTHIAVRGSPSRCYDPGQVDALSAQKYITRWTFFASRYTASIDAALLLVPVDWNVTLRGCNDSWHVVLNSTNAGPLRQSFGFNVSAPLALTAAALRARAILIEKGEQA